MRNLSLMLLMALPTPALAAGTVAIPEPSTLALFGMGVLGVMIGRQGSRRKRD